MKHVKMNGPSLRDPQVMVNRTVAEVDVQAYVAAGYKMGFVDGYADPESVKDPNPKKEKAEPAEEKTPKKVAAKKDKQ